MRRGLVASVVGVLGLLLGLEAEAKAERSLEDYRWFRALSIDLVGRVPSREELAAFEAPGFDLDRWIDQQLAGPGYADRVLRVYVDALRLELGDAFKYVQPLHVLRRFPVDVANADGTTKRTWLYYRSQQRRVDPATDRKFCLTTEETGQAYKQNQTPIPEFPTKAVPIAGLLTRATRVKPWWLYRDYASAAPANHYRTWGAKEPRFVLGLPGDKPGPALVARDDRLLLDADGTEVDDVWVCKEEAQAAERVTVRVRGAPTEVSCATDTGYTLSPACGCGPGLARCFVGAGFGPDPRSVVLADLAPLGPEQPFAVSRQQQSAWFRRMWSEEARQFLTRILAEDRDFRDVLTARYDWVNGPLVQFYRDIVGGDCCSDQIAFGGAALARPDPLLDPSRLPVGLHPAEMDRWVEVADRGPHAAGLLTLPAFLAKYASRRGRANAVYQTFLCREFVAENLDLAPSEEPNLMIRPGCSTCHAKLEPLAAYFSRTKESSFAFLSAPIDNPECARTGAGLSPACARYYDPAFSTASAGKLRGAYASAENADKGPAGLAAAVVAAPEFPTCAARKVVESMLGHATEPDDLLVTELGKGLAGGGFRMRGLVRALVKSSAYRSANAANAVAEGGAR